MNVQHPLLLAGHPRETDTVDEVRAPWDGRLLGRVAQAGPEDAAYAASAAERAFRVTRRLPARRRAATLEALADALHADRAALSLLVVHEGGKPLALARAEVGLAAAMLRRCAREAVRVASEVRTSAGRLTLARAVPRGPVLALPSADRPLASACAALGAAVAAGCPVVIRPPPLAPGATLALGEPLLAAGWPSEAISILPCDDALAAALVGDLRFATLHLGRDAPPCAVVAARLRRFQVLTAPARPVNLLIEPDAALPEAVAAVVRGASAHAGQLRGWAQRVLVHRSVWDEVRARLVAEAGVLPRGDPAREDVVCGPLLTRRAVARARGWIRAVEHLGGERLAGGDPEGSVLPPTVLSGEAPLYELLDGAPCAPVLVLEPYPSLGRAVDRLNRDRRRGDAAVFTRSVGKVWETFEALDATSLVHDAHPDAIGALPDEPCAAIRACLSPRSLHFDTTGEPADDPDPSLLSGV